MKLDGVTRNAFPAKEVNSLFPSFQAPVSANFNGASKDGHEYNVHVNPGESVRLTHDKYKLFEKLAVEHLPVPKYHNPTDLLLDGYFCIDTLEETYGTAWDILPLRIRNRDVERVISDIDDAFELMDMLQNPQAVIFQSLIPQPRIAQVSTIPAMVNRPCRNGKQMTNNGILSGDVYSILKKEIYETASLVIDTIGLDYGTVVFGYSEESFEIYDVHCRLELAHVPALSHFIELMCNEAKKGPRRKK